MRKFLGCVLLCGVAACNQIIGVSEGTPRPDDASAGAGAQASECTTNAECLAETDELDPSVCIDRRCVKLLSPDCPLLLPQTEGAWLESLHGSDPEPVVLGAFAPVPMSLYGAAARSIDLALLEFNRTVGGLPADGGARRPVLAVLCSDLYSDAAHLDTAVDHVLDELKVPAVIADFDSGTLIHAFQRRGRDRHVFFMSPSSAEQSLLDLEDDGLVWNVRSGGKALARVYPAVVKRTLEHLRNTGDLADGEFPRIAVVKSEDIANLDETAAAFSDLIELDGKPASDSSLEQFRTFSIRAGKPEAELQPLIEEVIDFRPHLIISAAAREFLVRFVPALESVNWEHRPTYLLSPLNYGDGALLDAAEASEELRTRMLGINWPGAVDKTAYDAYRARFDAVNPSFSTTLGVETFYDAAYYLLYAGVAAGPISPLSGSDFARGMSRLLTGRREFDVGPDDLPAASQALLTSGQGITLNGTLGPPDFDPETGARFSAGTVWCIGPESAELQPDVLRLDEHGELVGTFPCFQFP